MLRRRRAEKERSGTPADLLVVGLGNPGSKYEGTRHNVGVAVLEVLADRHDGRLRKGKELALVDEVRIDSSRVALAFPQTFMNDSGRSVVELVRRFGVDNLEKLVVVHDELDLPAGRIKVKLGGGLAGHNGLKSIRNHLHDDHFGRVRVGVGREGGQARGANYVLSRPTGAEREEIEIGTVEAADAVEEILLNGYETAMNRFNSGG